MDQQPKIPTLKDAQKPQVKVKGMGAGLTLFDRLKQFKKKDLAFILAGLGTLFMAPLAEHFMMAPESGSELKGGFGGGQGSNGGAGIFGNGSSPYENGNNSIAQGGAVGGAGDIITPLNVRDPSALVMGPGAAQQPPAGSAAPAVAPPASAPAKETDYKDALAGAASRAASAAVKKSPLPIPKIAVGGSGLRGLGAASGGSSAGASLGPIGPAAGSVGSGGGGSMNLVRSNPNFRGVAGARGPGNPTGLDGTKKAGANAGDAFSRTGSARDGLNAAAAEQIPTGGAAFNGGGAGGAGANDKPGGGGAAPGSKSVGESLAFIEAKERMMENLKLEFEKKKLMDTDLLLYGIRNDVLKASAGEVGKWITKGLMDKADSILGGGKDAAVDGFFCDGGKFYAKKDGYCLSSSGGNLSACKDGKFDPGTTVQGAANCGPGTKTGAADTKADPKAKGDGTTGTNGVNGDLVQDGSGSFVMSVGAICTKLDSINAQGGDKADAADQTYNDALYKDLGKYASIRDALTGTQTQDCTGRAGVNGRLTSANRITPNIAGRQKAVLDTQLQGLVDTLKKDLPNEKGGDYAATIKAAADPIKQLRTDIDTLSKDAGVMTATPGDWGKLKLVKTNAEVLANIKSGATAAMNKANGDLAKAVEAQNKIDGNAKDGKEGSPAVYPQLVEIVNGKDSKVPIAQVQGTNAAFTKFLSETKGPDGSALTDPKEGTKTDFYNKDKPAVGIGAGAKGGSDKDKGYDARETATKDAYATAAKSETTAKEKETAKAPDAETARKTATDDKATAEGKLKDLKGTVLGVRDAQSQWLDAVGALRQDASDKIPK